MPFIKLDKSLTVSSLWLSGDAEEIVMWIYLLTHADYITGVVDESLPAIAHGCHVSNERAVEILQKFASPDKFSRSSQFEGRRIVLHCDPQWMVEILNYKAYQNRDYTAAARKRSQREREAQLAKLDPGPRSKADE